MEKLETGQIADQKPKKTPQKSIFVAVIGILAVLYLINPGFGIFELIPDNFPIIGNLDEAAAALIVINALAYFGIDLKDFFSRRR